MNFKKNWKRFVTVSRASEGFTLVELIVVIAILAILAGIAVPAYSGYIKKANKAADLQILAAVNTAFAAAALENGDDINEITGARLSFSGSEGEVKVTGVAAVGSPSGASAAEYNESFQRYYAGNDSAAFKVITGLDFDLTKHCFVEGTGGSGTMTGAQLQEQVNRYQGSNFSGNEEELLGTVGTLSGMLIGEIGGVNLGAFMDDETYNAFLADYGLTSESTDTERANALIMHTASQLQGVTAQDVATLTGGNLNNYTALVEEYGMIPTAALMYGVMTGYAQSGGASADFMNAYGNPPTGVNDVMNMIGTMVNDSGWNDYMANDVMADTEGFLAAMEILNGHSGNFDLTQSNAFTNQAAQDLLNSILGSN